MRARLLTASLALLFPLLGNSTASTASSGSKVWICTGSSSKTYHLYKDCSGLDNCKARKVSVTVEKAREMKRRPCKKCLKKKQRQSLTTTDERQRA